jgi:hypothetical protein
MGRRLRPPDQPYGPGGAQGGRSNHANAFGLAAFHLDRMADHFPPSGYPRVKRSTFEHGVVLARSGRTLSGARGLVEYWCSPSGLFFGRRAFPRTKRPAHRYGSLWATRTNQKTASPTTQTRTIKQITKVSVDRSKTLPIVSICYREDAEMKLPRRQNLWVD